MNSYFLSFVDDFSVKSLYKDFSTKEAKQLYLLEDNFIKPFIFNQTTFLNLIHSIESKKEAFSFFKNLLLLLNLDCSISITKDKNKLGYFHPIKNTIFISAIYFDFDTEENKNKFFYTCFHEIAHAFCYKHFDDLYHGAFFIFSLNYIFSNILNIKLELEDSMFSSVLFFDYFKENEFELVSLENIKQKINEEQLSNLIQYKEYIEFEEDSDFIYFWIFSFHSKYYVFYPKNAQQRLESRLLNRIKKH